MENINSVSVNGIKLYAFQSMDELIDYSIDKHKMLIAINARKVMICTPDLKEMINKNIGYADGLGAKLAIDKKSTLKGVKIPGCEIWLRIISRYISEKSFYFIGSSENTITRAIEKLKIEFPSINIAGFRNGYINSESEKNDLIRDIKDKKPDVVFVAMGSPKQEEFMKELIVEYPALYQGLGGSFDAYIGEKKLPPKLIKKMRLESFYYVFYEGMKKPKERLRRVKSSIKMVLYLYLNKI